LVFEYYKETYYITFVQSLKNFTRVTKNQSFTVPSHHKVVQQNKMVMFSDVPVFAETSATCVQLLVL